MRSTRILASILAGLCLAGCTSSAALDGLSPSSETTSSIPRPNVAVPEVKQALSEAVADAESGDAAGPELQDLAAAPPAAIAAEDDLPPSRAARLKPVPKAGSGLQVAALVEPDRPDAAAKAFNDFTVHRRRFRDAKPINFGKSAPSQLAVHGVDVSRWQGNIDWLKLRGQGANFVYIKATDGGDHLDPMFKKNWRDANQAGLKRGAYHFFYWCRAASDQADWFIRNVPRVAGALPPVIDVEWNGDSACKKRPTRARVLEKMQVFMDRLEAHYGQRPVIYTAPDFYRDNLKGAFPNHPFWLRAVAQHPSKVYPGRKWVFWQYSGSGLSHGVKGRIDLNVFNGSEKDWRRWAGGQSLTADAD